MSRGAFLIIGVGLCISSGSFFDENLVGSVGLALAGWAMLSQAFKDTAHGK